MNLPNEIMEELLKIATSFNAKELTQKFKEVSKRYCGEKEGETLLNQEKEAVAYAASRMPATYGAVSTALKQTLFLLPKEPSIETLLDVGAGTGAATIACGEQLRLEHVTCLEREEAMMKTGKQLLQASSNSAVKNAKWEKIDIGKEEYGKKADFVVASYLLNELETRTRLQVLEKLWNMTNEILLLVEPGTPRDYQHIMEMKQYLLERGANLIAPCTCDTGCDLSKEDWCHFLCRVERTRLQKNVKDATVPYEDEKFTYLAVSKSKLTECAKARVIRHPIQRQNMVEVRLCEEGKVTNRIYTKKDKELYKKARKWKVGDLAE